MRNNSFVLFLLGFLLAFAAAQTASSTDAAPSPTEATPSETSPAATESATVAPTGSGSASDSATAPDSSSPTTTAPSSSGGSGGGTGTTSASSSSSTPPDVLLRVPNLSVKRIELDVDNLQAEINLAADVAGLVSINAGVQIGIQKVNITIADVEAQLELIIRLGHLVDIVNRTLQSLDLNPLLINLLNDLTDVVTEVIGAVDGLLGSIVQGDSKLNFIIDNLGNIVQEVVGTAGSVLSSIVGNYQQNMTFTGEAETLSGGLVKKTYEYSPLGSLVDIIFNALGQVVQATVVKSTSTATSGTTATTASPTSPATSVPAQTTSA